MNKVNNHVAQEVAQETTGQIRTDNNRKGDKPNKLVPTRNRKNNMWNLVTSARNQFNKQFHKSNQLKYEILDSIVKVKRPDYEKFWLEYFQSAEKLQDSKKYCETCAQMRIDEFILATHLVFLGKVAVDKVLTDGIENTLGNNLNLYSEPFLSQDVLNLRKRPVAGLLPSPANEPPAAEPVANPVNE